MSQSTGKPFWEQISVTCNLKEPEEKNNTFKSFFKHNDKFNKT